jgi:metal-dependent amidase/aminoacylase/carboxypeptidase family protein
MHFSNTKKWHVKAAACASMFALSVFGFGVSAQAADPDMAVDAIKTATPIKHVIRSRLERRYISTEEQLKSAVANAGESARRCKRN